MVNNRPLDNLPCTGCCCSLDKDANDSTRRDETGCQPTMLTGSPTFRLVIVLLEEKSDSSRCSSGRDTAGRKHTFFPK